MTVAEERRLQRAYAAAGRGSVRCEWAHGRWRFYDEVTGLACTTAVWALERAGLVAIDWSYVPGRSAPVVQVTRAMGDG